MNVQRLMTLAEFLTTVEEARFDITHWASNWDIENTCHSTACAIGWGTTIPEFKHAGLRLVVDALEVAVNPSFQGYTGVEAVSKFFDITDDDAMYLFFADASGLMDDATPSEVSRHIRRFVENGGGNRNDW